MKPTGIVFLAAIVLLSFGPTTAWSTSPNITVEQYDRMRAGMTYAQACAAVGTYGVEVSQSNAKWKSFPFSGSITMVMYRWMNSNGSNITAMFKNGRLMTKAQSGLTNDGPFATSLQLPTKQQAAPLSARSSDSADSSASKTEAQSTSQEAKGIIVRFTSKPPDAEVNIDGEYWGATPTADLFRLSAGPHTILVKKPGYQPWERKITLAPGDDRTISAELESQPNDPTRPRIVGNN